MKIHLDLDSFFVSAHRIEDKTLLNKPVVVVKRNDKEIFKNEKTKLLNLNEGAFTGDLIVGDEKYDKSYFLENGKVRGIVVTASYEARELGIKTGTTLAEALRIYPKLTVLTPNYKLYHILSYKLKLFLEKKIPLVEQYSIDEFFGDLEGWVNDGEIYGFIKTLKDEIWKRFNLPVSIGAAKSKWTAKLATSFAKPDGIKVVKNIDEFIENIPVEKFPGIGKRIEKRIKEKGILTLGDVKREKEYFYSWGKAGVQLYNRVCGTDNEKVIQKSERKSIGISRRFDPVYDRKEIIRRIGILCRYLSFLVKKKKVNPTFYYLSIKYKHSKKSKAHITLDRIFNEMLLKEVMVTLFYRADIEDDYIISLGISVSKFKKVSNLFDLEEDRKMEKLNDAIYKLRSRYGLSALISASEII
ncbi:DNA-directed DNA polymerase [Nautilia profundicola AmH]|uniref:DNA-directed DNA polymerase n=1 Tax=Nautilia profundicola (strain ATCC BAA-1463 / DSM 18972 / AmH) TaxID=598659 RepID=B9L8S0_NAUPA|nr:DNA polymerase IV [Nautilia profundicola]ACM93650.1 DNA-directed DNA polymerase [Nautilia profundicola AmH]